MSPPTKLAAFALALLLTFGAGWTLGHAVGPLDRDPPHEMVDHR